jgi:hypothetical protein
VSRFEATTALSDGFVNRRMWLNSLTGPPPLPFGTLALVAVLNTLSVSRSGYPYTYASTPRLSARWYSAARVASDASNLPVADAVGGAAAANTAAATETTPSVRFHTRRTTTPQLIARRLGHIPLADSYATPQNSASYDAFHVNAIQPLSGDGLLVSARDTSAIYEIEAASGSAPARGSTSSTMRRCSRPVRSRCSTTRPVRR